MKRHIVDVRRLDTLRLWDLLPYHTRSYLVASPFIFRIEFLLPSFVSKSCCNPAWCRPNILLLVDYYIVCAKGTVSPVHHHGSCARDQRSIVQTLFRVVDKTTTFEFSSFFFRVPTTGLYTLVTSQPALCAAAKNWILSCFILFGKVWLISKIILWSPSQAKTAI